MNTQTQEVFNYGINGVVATAVHYGVLTFNLQVIEFPSAGMANFIAAAFGISASFLGSRYFVFSTRGESIINQAVKFGGVYGFCAVLHGLVLLVWSDWYFLDYRWGFLIATSIQASLSYLGNKFLVFKK